MSVSRCVRECVRLIGGEYKKYSGIGSGLVVSLLAVVIEPVVLCICLVISRYLFSYCHITALQ